MNINIDSLDITELPRSWIGLACCRRRGGKTTITEYLIKELYNVQRVNFCFLFSKTDAGFDFIPREDRFKDLEMLTTIVENYKMMNQYNDCCPKSKQIKLNSIIIIDDFAQDLKDKCNKIIVDLAVNGRHIAKFGENFSLSIMILSQALTCYPRVVRLNSDFIMFNALSSIVETEMILAENFYILGSSRKDKQKGRELYHKLVGYQDFGFVCIQNWKQNIKEYNDYIKVYKAII